MPIRRELNQNFFKTWSPEMAYVLGFFAADGAMIQNKRGGHFIEFHSTDRILLDKIRRVIASTHRISARKRPKPWKTAYRLQIGSRIWFSRLEYLGFSQNKSLTLHFPNIPCRYRGDFVRGYFDGDGCIYFKKLKYADRKCKRWVMLSLFTSGSRQFLESLWLELKKNGIKGGTIQKKTHGFDLKLSHSDSLALYTLMYHTALATGLRLPRKHKLFTKAIRTLYPNAVVA